MKRRTFGEFVDRKKRECIKQLMTIKEMLASNGLKVDNFLTESEDDPYIYCYNPARSGSFDGIRIYKVGNTIAFRIQKENETHPYGSAYQLPIEEMFHDFLGDGDMDQEKAGKKVIESVTKEIRRFFDKSAEAESKEREQNSEMNKDSAGAALVRTTGTDYSALIYNKAG